MFPSNLFDLSHLIICALRIPLNPWAPREFIYEEGQFTIQMQDIMHVYFMI